MKGTSEQRALGMYNCTFISDCPCLQSGYVQNKLECPIEAVISLKLWLQRRIYENSELVSSMLNLRLNTEHFSSSKYPVSCKIKLELK